MNDDKINNPKHYTSSQATCSRCHEKIECIEISKEFGFHLGNVIKYIWRHQHKNGLEDLKKARFYLNDYIRRAGENETI